jgi:hypothetical protein
MTRWTTRRGKVDDESCLLSRASFWTSGRYYSPKAVVARASEVASRVGKAKQTSAEEGIGV